MGGDVEHGSRDVLEMADDCTARARASREFVEITTMQPSIALCCAVRGLSRPARSERLETKPVIRARDSGDEISARLPVTIGNVRQVSNRGTSLFCQLTLFVRAHVSVYV